MNNFESTFVLDEALQFEGGLQNLPIEQILPNPAQPRRYFEPVALADLAESIQAYGLIQPITVRQIEGGYELIAGERRLRASKLAGMSYILATVVEISDIDSAVLAMVENLQRQDLNYIEEAEGYSRLIFEHDMTQEALAKKLGRNQSTIANKLRLLKLLPTIKRRLITENLSERHARALLRLEKLENKESIQDMQLFVLDKIIAEKLTVLKTEELVDKILKNKLSRMKKTKNVKTYIRDMRIFTESIKQTVDTMSNSGLNASYEVEEREDGCYISIMVVY